MIFKKTTANFFKNVHLVEKRIRAFGRSYEWIPSPEEQELGIYYARLHLCVVKAVCLLVTLHKLLFILSKVRAKIYLHKRGQFTDLSGRMGHKVYINHSMQFQVNYEDIRYNIRLTFANMSHDEG